MFKTFNKININYTKKYKKKKDFQNFGNCYETISVENPEINVTILCSVVYPAGGKHTGKDL